jgi:micrococcal nuclease
MRIISLALALAGAILDPVDGMAVSDCEGPSAGTRTHLLRLDKNDSLVLSDGHVVHLEGIRLPAGKLDRAPQSFADESRAAILALVKTAPLTSHSLPPKIDRHGRLRAEVFAGDQWIQAVLLNRGLARVSIAPDRTDCASELFAAEAQARIARRGLWAAPAYAVRDPSNVQRDIGTFQIVEGKVLNASVKNGRAYLNFGADWRRDFTATVDPVDMPNFRALGVDPRSYAGQTVRVRGWVEWHNGPEVEVASPQGIEVVQ